MTHIKKVALIETPLHKHAVMDPIHKAQSIGLGYVGSYLKQRGTDVMLIDATAEGYDRKKLFGWGNKTFEKLRNDFCNDFGVLNDDELIDKYRLLEKNNSVRVGLSDIEVVKKIEDYKPDVVGINVIASVLHPSYISLVASIKERFPDTLVIAGGDHPTNLPEECLKAGTDFVISGEGEKIFHNIVQNPRPEDIKRMRGISYLEGGILVTNHRNTDGKGRIIDNLDVSEISVIDPSLYTANYPEEPTHGGTSNGRKYIDMDFSRGCGGSCSFCNSWRTIGGFRQYDMKKNRKQLELLAENGYEEILIQDDNFTVSPSHKKVIDLLYNMGFSWQNNGGLELETLTPEEIEYSAKRGCHTLFIPLNTGRKLGDTQLRKQLKNKAHEIFSTAKDNGIHVFSGGILGIPSKDVRKTREDSEKLIEFAGDLVSGGYVDYWVNYILDALPGCGISKRIETRGREEGIHVYGGKQNWAGYSHHFPQVYTDFMPYRELMKLYLKSHREINGMENSRKWFGGGAWVS